jgi:hypothetical protein
MTSDTYPKGLVDIDERLTSRFDAGLTVAIEPPELEMRVAILMKKADAEGTTMPEDVAFFVAKNVRANVRELEGALRKILAYSRFSQKDISIALARDALKDLPALLSANPEACVFFDNVLGQLRFQNPATDWQQVERRLKQLKVQLKGREWGSLHDRMSGPCTRPIALDSALPVRHPDWHDQHWLTQLDAQSPWLDHLTQDVFPTVVSVQNFAWNFSANYRHWLQAGWVRP